MESFDHFVQRIGLLVERIQQLENEMDTGHMAKDFLKFHRLKPISLLSIFIQLTITLSLVQNITKSDNQKLYLISLSHICLIFFIVCVELSNLRSENIFKQARIIELNVKIESLMAHNLSLAQHIFTKIKHFSDETRFLDQSLKLRFDVEQMKSQKSYLEKELLFIKTKYEREKRGMQDVIDSKETEIAILKKS